MPHRISQDDASAEKPDASQNALNDARDRIRIGGTIQRSERDKRSERGTATHQRVGPESGRFAMQLAIQTENRSEEKRGAEAQHGLFISGKHPTRMRQEDAN